MFNTLWIDKYKPKSLNEIVGNELIIENLKEMVKSKNIPNMIFSGISGIGKTSTAICMLRDLYKEDFFENILELNASDDLRKIDKVKDQLNTFSKSEKIIIFDEADNMTTQVQHTLRSIIDENNKKEIKSNKKKSRFVLICNNLTNIIESLQSRCIIFKFYPLKNKNIIKKINYILKNENIIFDSDKTLEYLIKSCNGDLRCCINNLQSLDSFKSKDDSNIIKIEDIKKIIDIPHKNIVINIFDFINKKDYKNSFENLLNLYNLGYSVIDIIETFSEVCFNLKIKEEQRIKFQKLIIKYQTRIGDGYTNYLQLFGLISELLQIN